MKENIECAKNYAIYTIWIHAQDIYAENMHINDDNIWRFKEEKT